jgi:hypothetical protein
VIRGPTAGIIEIAVGVAVVVSGLRAREFYAAFIRRRKPGQKPVPRFLGIAVFLAVGLWFIYTGCVTLWH